MRTSDPLLQNEILCVLERYYTRHDRSPDLMIQAGERVETGIFPASIPEMLQWSSPHDEDFHVFRIFTDPEQVILDIGSNWGYSIGSLLAVGSRSRVVSFEAMPFHSSCLEVIGTLAPIVHRFRIVALSDSRCPLVFVTPVINGRLLSGLSSANPDPQLDVFAKNIRDYITQWERRDEISLKFLEDLAWADTLDSVLASDQSLIDQRPIVAIKIDVEGLEYSVLKGALQTLSTHKPLVMAEGGNRWPHLSDYMNSNGYAYAERDGSRLAVREETGTACNGFFLHHDKMDDYRRSGIL